MGTEQFARDESYFRFAAKYNGSEYGITTSRLVAFIKDKFEGLDAATIFLKDKDLPRFKKDLQGVIGRKYPVVFERISKILDKRNLGVFIQGLSFVFIKVPELGKLTQKQLDVVSIFSEATAIHEIAHLLALYFGNSSLPKIWVEGFSDLSSVAFLEANLTPVHLEAVSFFLEVNVISVTDYIEGFDFTPANLYFDSIKKTGLLRQHIYYGLVPGAEYKLGQVIRILSSLNTDFFSSLLNLQRGDIKLEDFKSIINQLIPPGFIPHNVVPDFGRDFYTYLTRTGDDRDNMDYNIDNKLKLVRALYQYYQDNDLLPKESL